MALIEVKLRPTGPWRAGHRAGDRERVDVIYHSDALYSAITHAMRALGWLDEWLEATAGSELAPAVRFSSLFPFIGKTRLITPPRSAWPNAAVKLVPLELARGGVYDKTRWQADIPSECLLPQGSHPPFQVALRSAAAVDRLTGNLEPHRIACLEFASNAGLWGVYEATPEWEPRVRSAFRLLADSGFGGERSRGWGRSQEPVFSTASALFPDQTPNGSWWLLSLFSPHQTDQIDWTKGDYAFTVRGGWTDSPQGVSQKKQLRMIEEGGVLSAEELTGRTLNVAPEGFPHPVYRNGQALSVPLPSPTPAAAPKPAPTPEPAQDTRLSSASPETTNQPEPEVSPAPEPTPEPEDPQ
jgi:CRISPR/Cas system CSM-associated protein Csm4 (group 5 of RAMP superfamily)